MPAQAGLSLTVKNLPEVLAALKRAGLTISEAAHRGIEKTCIRIEGTAKKNAPHFEGELRRSITHEVSTPLGSAGNAIEGRVGSNLDYAEHVERGVKPGTKVPFFAPIGATLYGARWLEKHGFAVKSGYKGRIGWKARGDRGRVPLGIMVYGRAHPFLLPAFEANKQHAEGDLASSIRAALSGAK